ncbi:MAG: helix-turn-helix transcriptional regulator [Clostridiales bacterium]|jgi:DNA-binding CsgD family transcriptional regulator|nr:helix-turn-helix transcriptional regulator [Clostridiales bacterium]
MALFDRLKTMLRTEGRTSDTDVSLESRKKSSKELARSVYEGSKDDTEKEKQNLVSMLTPREADLFNLLLEGYTLKESAKELSIKYSTANTHMTAIYKKLKVNSRAELIIKYRGSERSE